MGTVENGTVGYLVVHFMLVIQIVNYQDLNVCVCVSVRDGSGAGLD